MLLSAVCSSRKRFPASGRCPHIAARTARRALAGVIGAGAITGVTLVGAIPSALADPPPNCTAADLAGVASGVAASTSAYLFTHPDANNFFTSLKGQPKS